MVTRHVLPIDKVGRAQSKTEKMLRGLLSYQVLFRTERCAGFSKSGWSDSWSVSKALYPDGPSNSLTASYYGLAEVSFVPDN
jgi:hypothetical protein